MLVWCIALYVRVSCSELILFNDIEKVLFQMNFLYKNIPVNGYWSNLVQKIHLQTVHVQYNYKQAARGSDLFGFVRQRITDIAK
jgi:hypothetical protein